MAKTTKHKPWHLKFTWTLSLVMLVLILGFFYQSFEAMREITPVQVAVERISERAEPTETESETDAESHPESESE